MSVQWSSFLPQESNHANECKKHNIDKHSSSFPLGVKLIILGAVSTISKLRTRNQAIEQHASRNKGTDSFSFKQPLNWWIYLYKWKFNIFTSWSINVHQITSQIFHYESKKVKLGKAGRKTEQNLVKLEIFPLCTTLDSLCITPVWTHFWRPSQFPIKYWVRVWDSKGLNTCLT